jgi:hypothetical protein
MSKITVAFVIIREHFSSGNKFPVPVYFTDIRSALKAGIIIVRDIIIIIKIKKLFFILFFCK